MAPSQGSTPAWLDQQPATAAWQVLDATELDAPVAAGHHPEDRQQRLGERGVEAEVVDVELTVAMLLTQRGEAVVDAHHLLQRFQVDEVAAGQRTQLEGQHAGGPHGGGRQVTAQRGEGGERRQRWERRERRARRQ